MHNEDMDMGLGVVTSLLHDVNTNVYSAVNNTMISDDATTGITVDDDAVAIDVDVVHVYIHVHEGDRACLLDPGASRYRVRPQ